MALAKTKIVRFERLLNDILALNNGEEAKLLLHVILQGGFTTKDTFYSKFNISRPTLIKKISTLIEKGYLRQNEEFNPIRITLLVDYEELLEKILEQEQKIRFARDFLIKMSVIKSRGLLAEKFKSAIKVLLGNVHKRELLIEVLSLLYIQRNLDSIEVTELNGRINSVIGEIRLDVFMTILNCNSELFRVFSQKVGVEVNKRRKFKKTYFVTTKYNLEKLAKILFLKRKFELRNYTEELEELFSTFKPLSYDYFPHQLLPYVSNIKQRVNSCLKFYSQLYIIYNGIYDQSFDSFIKLIIKNDNFSKHHRLKLLSSQQLSYSHLQLSSRIYDKSVGKDYKERDIILFCSEDQPYGALIFPKKPLTPYYLITPHAINEIYTQFRAQWGD
ncbi:MAG: hypothetical protein ACTSW1_09290 [Candidatus Hodarchaeales archaeon]